MVEVLVLLVEPDKILADVYRSHLEKFNYKIRVVGGVQQAIMDMDIQRPDVIILELKLANHNGYEFLYELRSYGEWQNIPVIINSMISEEEAGLNQKTKKLLGITGFLYKPKTNLGKLHYELNKQSLVNKI
jgi:CheY-like chemotaxis protein